MTIAGGLGPLPTEAQLLDLYRAYYASAPFVRVTPYLPATKDSAHSNFIDITLRIVHGAPSLRQKAPFRVIKQAMAEGKLRGVIGIGKATAYDWPAAETDLLSRVGNALAVRLPRE